jgi:hypothetical protein
MSRLSSRILSSSSSLRMMMSSSSSLFCWLGVSVGCSFVRCLSSSLSGLIDSESDSLSDDDDDESVVSDSELSSSLLSDSDSVSSSSDSSFAGLSGFCGAFCNLFRVVSGKI